MVGYGYGFNTIFNNISVLSWQSVLLVEETSWIKENKIDLHTFFLYCNMICQNVKMWVIWMYKSVQHIIIGNVT